MDYDLSYSGTSFVVNDCTIRPESLRLRVFLLVLKRVQKPYRVFVYTEEDKFSIILHNLENFMSRKNPCIKLEPIQANEVSKYRFVEEYKNEEDEYIIGKNTECDQRAVEKLHYLVTSIATGLRQEDVLDLERINLKPGRYLKIDIVGFGRENCCFPIYIDVPCCQNKCVYIGIENFSFNMIEIIAARKICNPWYFDQTKVRIMYRALLQFSRVLGFQGYEVKIGMVYQNKDVVIEPDSRFQRTLLLKNRLDSSAFMYDQTLSFVLSAAVSDQVEMFKYIFGS